MKKNKLYTVTRFNRSMFMPTQENLFFPGGAIDWGSAVEDYANSKNAFGITKKDNPFSKMNLKNTFSSANLESMANAGIGAAAGIVGGLAGNAISGGLSSGAGRAISGLGSTIGGAVGAVNPIAGAAISVGSQVLGGVTNALFGSAVDEKKLNAAKEGTAAYNNFVSNASSFDAIQGPTAQANVEDAYRGGLFTSGSARKKNEELKRQRIAARQFADRSILNNVNNIAADQMNNALANYSAFGGPLDFGDGALGYGMAMDYLTMKKRESENKNKMAGLQQVPTFMPQNGLFAFGGDLQTNGADFPTMLTHIDAGLRHEENPYEGVQLGVDGEGVPNLVEEGETIFDNYVYSNRILADEATKRLFKLPKKQEITYAEITKKLEKEISERSNDPISKAGFKKQMAELADQQERQKKEMEAARAREAFEALSPEEQTTVMNNAVQQQAQQQVMAEQAAMQQPTPEEIAMAQEQQMMADGSQPNLGQEPQMNAFGGKINRFDNGGKAYTRMLNSLGFHTKGDFEKWAKDNDIDFGDLWKDNDDTLNIKILSNLWKNDKFKEALRKKNPALAHAFEDKGFDFGFYEPGAKDKVTIQSISKGNWKATNGKGWRGSEDLAFRQATEGLSDDEIDALTTEQLADRMKKTEAYQNTNKWLQNSDNALMYLNTLMNDPDTPQVAKDYAAKYVKDGKWKDGFNYDYATVFGSNGKEVRETNPGTYWHTAMEANRGNQTGNFVINEDGSIEPIVGNVPTDWASAGNYTWFDEDNDYAYNYYKRPVVTTPTSTPAPAENNEDDGKEVAPRHRAEWMRYAGLFGPAVGLGMQMAGIGRPDTGAIDAAISGAGDVTPASYKPIGNYLTYKPLDIWYEQNRLNANARATDRAIMNSSGPGRMAGLLANGYNNQIASGNLFRQAQEYNDALRRQVAEFNRGTDMYNSEQFGQTSRFNADTYNRARQANAQMRLHAAQQKAAMDADWYNGIYGNVAGLFKGISDLGRENVVTNWRNGLVTSGAMGIVNPDALVDAGIAEYKKDKKNKGGKIKKRGLTI